VAADTGVEVAMGAETEAGGAVGVAGDQIAQGFETSSAGQRQLHTAIDS